MSKDLIKLNNISARVYDRLILKNTSWVLKEGENWLFIGPNGSGKSTLAGLLKGLTPVVRGLAEFFIDQKNEIAIVSFENLRKITESEEIKNESRFFSSDDSTTKVSDILGNKLKKNNGINSIIDLNFFSEKNFHTLSTGEKRKVLIIKALLAKPKLLILDEPFEGLDLKSASKVKGTIEEIINSGTQVILITHRLNFIPDRIDKVLPFKNLKTEPPLNIEEFNSCLSENLFTNEINLEYQGKGIKENTGTIIDFKKLNISYDNKDVYRNFSWTVSGNENWKITGPNGSGKSTLLSLITADNLLAYSNEIYIFGKRRGSGESIFDIKKRMGIVSPELQLRYLKKIPLIDVVLSGFYDSIGLYRKPSKDETDKALKMIESSGFDRNKRFDHLSFGEQRIILILRALIKSPDLLVLDEPCQGLDPFNRKKVLQLCDHIGFNTGTRLLYVSHLNDEKLNCINRELILTEGTDYEIRHLGEKI